MKKNRLMRLRARLVQTCERTRAQWPAAALAFMVWSSWAFWVNQGAMDAGKGHFLLTALAQGMASFAITLALAAAVTTLSDRLRGRRGQVWLPPLWAVGCTTSLLASVHLLIGTPHILATIALPSLVAFSYGLFLSFRLARRASED